MDVKENTQIVITNNRADMAFDIKASHMLYNLLIITLMATFLLSRAVVANAMSVLFEITLDASIYQSIQITSFSIVSFLYIKRGKISKIILLFSGFVAALLISTIITGYDLYAATITLGGMLGACILLDMEMNRNPVNAIKCLITLFAILVYINFFVATPLFTDINHIGDVSWFLGHRNTVGNNLVPLLCFLVIYSYHKDNSPLISIFIYLTLAVALYTVIAGWSATSIVGISLAFIYIVILYRLKLPRILNIRNYVIVTALFFFVFIIFNFQFIFRGFIETVLQRDLTFTNRTILWERAFESIAQNPLVGVGLGYHALHDIFHWQLYDSHNFILELLVTGGLLGFATFSAIFIAVYRKLDRSREHKISDVVSFFFFIYLIMAMVETTFYQTPFYLMLILSYNVNKIIFQHEQINAPEYRKSLH